MKNKNKFKKTNNHSKKKPKEKAINPRTSNKNRNDKINKENVKNRRQLRPKNFDIRGKFSPAVVPSNYRS